MVALTGGAAARSLRSPVRAAHFLAGAAAIAILALATPASAHDPDLDPVEALGNPAGLAGIPFVGPPGTPIEDKPCEPLTEAQRVEYDDDGTGHIGHISSVQAVRDGTLGGFILPNSVDLWHLELDAYNNPRQIEGPAPAQGVIMGIDGFFRGQMDATIHDLSGPDLRITDVHQMRTYCIYGALEHAGPYFFIDSTFRDPVATSVTNLDLNGFFTPLFKSEYPDEQPRMDYILLVASIYDDPGLQADFIYEHLDAPLDLTLDPGVKFTDISWVPMGNSITSRAWAFGDGAYGSGITPIHEYGHAGTYTVCLTITVASGDPIAPACKPVTVNNRPPEVDFICPPTDAPPGPVTFPTQASDRDGWVTSWVYDWGDGTSSSDLYHEYEAPGVVTVRVRVTDDLDAPAEAVHDCLVPGPANKPPILQAPRIVRIDLGSTFEFCVVSTDPEGDLVTLHGLSLPPGASFDPATGCFAWRPERADYIPVYFRARDPPGLEANARTDLLVVDPRVDQDHDGVADVQDVCPSHADPDQADTDRDGAGDACDPMPLVPGDVSGPGPAGAPLPGDRDADGVADLEDACPDDADPAQRDRDVDGLGDACDPDRDGDGVPEVALGGSYVDECPDSAQASRASECAPQLLGHGRTTLPPGELAAEVAQASSRVGPVAMAAVAALLSAALAVAGSVWAVRRWS